MSKKTVSNALYQGSTGNSVTYAKARIRNKVEEALRAGIYEALKYDEHFILQAEQELEFDLSLKIVTDSRGNCYYEIKKAPHCECKSLQRN